MFVVSVVSNPEAEEPSELAINFSFHMDAI